MDSGMTDDIPDLFMFYEFDINAIRMISEHIMTATVKGKIEFSVNPEANAQDISRVWNKIDYWMETTNQALILSANNGIAVGAVLDEQTGECRFANTIMLLPGEPTEEVLGYVIQAKLNALGEDVLAFGSLELKARESQGVSFSLIGDPDVMLPTMQEWMGGRNWFKAPWWHRDDGSMLDAAPDEDADLSDKPEWAYSWDFLGKSPKSTLTKSGGSVITGRFKPRMVEPKDEPKDE